MQSSLDPRRIGGMCITFIALLGAGGCASLSREHTALDPVEAYCRPLERVFAQAKRRDHSIDWEKAERLLGATEPAWRPTETNLYASILDRMVLAQANEADANSERARLLQRSVAVRLPEIATAEADVDLGLGIGPSTILRFQLWPDERERSTDWRPMRSGFYAYAMLRSLEHPELDGLPFGAGAQLRLLYIPGHPQFYAFGPQTVGKLSLSNREEGPQKLVAEWMCPIKP